MKAKWERNTKKNKASGAKTGSMHSAQRHGLDYSPLFKFLLSRVGNDWDETFSEALSRLDRREPIFWMVALNELDKFSYFRAGESSYYSGLCVTDDNTLAFVDPEINEDSLEPFCSCCTHTFNGRTFSQSYQLR